LGIRKADEAVSISSHLAWRAATKPTLDWS
jgi:hypothetical protein